MKKYRVEEIFMLPQKEFIIWGATRHCKLLLLLNKFYFDKRVKAVFDKDPEKWCIEFFDEVHCCSPYFLSNEIPILICTYKESSCMEVVNMCKELGYQNTLVVDVDEMNQYIHNLSDKEYLEVSYCISMNKTSLDFDNPITYNEKLQWLKIYNREERYTQLADKYEVKGFVEKRIGKQYVIPTIGVWENADEIDFRKLPDIFVLKCTHDSGGTIICNKEYGLNEKEIKKRMNELLKRNFFYLGREYPYKNIKPRIIAEPFMVDSKTKELRDYKFFVFNGEVKAMFIASERQSSSETKFDFFDRDFNHIDCVNGHPNALVTPEKPSQYEKMIELAQILAEGMIHVRVDFYEVDGEIYFGEMTFYHWSGFKPFEPEKWDLIFGSWLKLPNKIPTVTTC